MQTDKFVNKSFPNYYILNNFKVAHQQKVILHAMLSQETCPRIMIREFCRLARKFMVGNDGNIRKF